MTATPENLKAKNKPDTHYRYAVVPGITDTEPHARIHTGPEMEACTASASALNWIGQPSDIADIVAFLASDDARWITGDLIDATGTDDGSINP